MNGFLVACPWCGLIQRLEAPQACMAVACGRCGSLIARAEGNSLNRTAAFSLAALFLYVPANIYPIMRMEFHGVFIESTVWDGCVRLFQDGQWFVAIVVFLASLIVPLLKLLGLFFLVTTTSLNSRYARSARTRIYRIIGWIGPWAMLDVFLLAILVALVKFGRVATVTPGPGLVAFTAVVVLTILASASFEPRQIWEGRHGNP
jgi:paraquat-inducible protein A